ncbi:hypothetical protein [Scopulibacillus cellulosilyticus]|uniref:Uncharacterized protein n=1 Tax=Scopulibacillus cellulosilyticus TaxID=2665665 RepID=A0ABW2PXY7_9BACL
MEEKGSIPITYEDFCDKVSKFTGHDFQDFCNRYQSIFYRKFRATKARGRLGDYACDGIIIPNERLLACYGFYNDTKEIGKAIAKKMKDDFVNMLEEHPNIECMIFMTKTSGMEKTVIKKIEELESKEFQLNNIKRFKNFKSDPDRFIVKKIEYVDCQVMFNRLRDIKKGEM